MVSEPSGWTERIEEEREFKTGFFAAHPQSPIPPEERKEFKGLNYYPPKLDYRFELELNEHQDKKRIKMAYTKGGEQEFLQWGTFKFEIAGIKLELQAYKSDPNEERLFVPFKDTTNGKETYGAGRYIDLDERHKTSEGKWILDFNKAYNPWCAYSEKYTCPFVRPENWITEPIRAGEKKYQKEKRQNSRRFHVHT